MNGPFKTAVVVLKKLHCRGCILLVFIPGHLHSSLGRTAEVAKRSKSQAERIGHWRMWPGYDMQHGFFIAGTGVFGTGSLGQCY